MGNEIESGERTEVTEASSSGRYLSFEIGAESYGLDILNIQEIVSMMDITPVPRTPESLLGVMNLRGKIIPVLSLRSLFGIDQQYSGARACIIVTRLGPEEGVAPIGLLVDEAAEVVEIPTSKIDKPPLLATNHDYDFIAGIAKTGKQVLLILKLERLLSETEQSAVLAALQREEDSETEATRDIQGARG